MFVKRTLVFEIKTEIRSLLTEQSMFKKNAAVASRKALAMFVAFATVLATAAMPAQVQSATTPVKHVVVIFQENVSFDHYFGSYPKAMNPAGEPAFHAMPDTPSVNRLNTGLLFHNPNSHRPFRLDRAQNYTCDQNHDYMPEQQAFDNGLMDKFVQFVGVGGPGCPDYGLGPALVMGYFDGNTVTALWNYAQHYAMSDNSYNTGFGPSTPGVLDLVSGNTGTVDLAHTTGDISGDVVANSVIGDPDPFYDDCASPEQIAMTGPNVGDLLNAKSVTWGWFQGGFAPTTPASAISPAVCAATTTNLGGSVQKDYSAHHEPFQYYKSTANRHHLPPTSVAMIGRTDQANHQYDLTDFWNAVSAGNMPAVSFLKAKRAQDGHAGYSSPLDEQEFIVSTLNALQQHPEWSSTAVIIAYDDSDGWYDHQMSPILRQSVSSQDALSGPGHCGSTNTGGIAGRCGYGPRLPLLVISPFAKSNFVDSTVTDQSSILRFLEDNFALGRIGAFSSDRFAGPLTNMLSFGQTRTDILLLDPSTGEPAR
jgi:phospholipase C